MIISVSLYTVDYLRLIIALVFPLLMSVSLTGQESWTTDQYLEFEINDISLPFEENINFLTNKAKGMPFVDNYEFRTETDEMELEQQQFQFRFQFNSREERKAYDKILSATKDRYSWLQSQYELDLWEERYKSVLDLIFLQKEQILIGQEFALLLDKKTVLKKLLDNKNQIDVEDWMGNENEIFNLRLDSIDLDLKKKEIGQKIFSSDRFLPELDDSNFIQIENLKNRVTDLLEKKTKHPEQEMAIADRNLADAEFQLENAEANKWLNFAQIEYQSDNKLSFQKEVSLSTSITIPSKNNNRIKKNDATLDLLERAYKANIKEDENERDIQLEKAKFFDLLNQYDEFKKLREDQNLESIYKDFAEKKIVSPTILIGIKRSIVKNDKKQLNLEKDIYESYINLLTHKSAFLSVPKINYLSE